MSDRIVTKLLLQIPPFPKGLADSDLLKSSRPKSLREKASAISAADLPSAKRARIKPTKRFQQLHSKRKTAERPDHEDA